MWSEPTFSCSLASVYTVSLYSISFCSLSVNLQVNVHTVHWYSSGECVWAPQSGVSLKLTRSPKLFVTQRMVVGILTNIHSLLRYTIVISLTYQWYTNRVYWDHKTVIYNCH